VEADTTVVVEWVTEVLEVEELVAAEKEVEVWEAEES
tara:strand:- start:270 stop:380 length:111 start_codon:yes stop_codon:yes gene_type:complete